MKKLILAVIIGSSLVTFGCASPVEKTQPIPEIVGEVVRIVTEPLPGFSGANVVVMENDTDIFTGRIYEKTLDRMSNSNIGDEFKDSNNKIWIKTESIKYDKNKIYIEI